MSLLDRSPGGFIAFACVVVYSTILAEIWMWTEATVFAVVLVLGLIIVMAGVICSAVVHFIGDEAPDMSPAPRRAEPAEAAPRAARPGRPAHVR